MRILVAYTFIPFQPRSGQLAAEQIAQTLRGMGSTVAVSALPVDSDPAGISQQSVWIRMLQLDPFADRLICLGGPAALLRHRDKRVWLADAFEVPLGAPADGVSYEVGIGEARLVARDSGPEATGRKNSVHLPVPSATASWQSAALALAS